MKRYLSLLAALFLPAVMFAQGTTSGSIEGTVSDASGEALPGANIVAIHQPTGTRYGTSSRPNGRYTLNNVRVGGPYEVQVTFVGFNAQKKEISAVELGETVELSFELEEGELTLGEISVTAEADQIFNAERTGAGNNVSREQIDRTPSIDRSLSDFTRLTPQVSGNSIAGRNNRLNSIKVDGAIMNDEFGLAASGTPGGQAGTEPISLDAIEEFQVNIAPYDVRQGGFTGGAVNAITRSGTNTFEGSVYFYGQNQNFLGVTPGEDSRSDGEKLGEFSDYETGFRLGGPIIEDKLFFFVNAEIGRRSQPNDTGISGSGKTNIFEVDRSQMEELVSFTQDEYGYDPGGFGNYEENTPNDKVFARLDYNINENNQLTLRHNYVDAQQDDGVSRGSFSYTLDNSEYVFNSTQNSTVLQLNSDLGSNIDNEARIVYTRIRDRRDPQGAPFPSVSIDNVGPNEGTINLGGEQYSQANALDQDIIEITNDFTYIAGDHELTFGTSNEFFNFSNTFIRDFYGAYSFDSIQDYYDANPYAYTHSYSLTDDPRQSAEWGYYTIGLYAQDEWRISDQFTLTAGLRVDMPIFPDTPFYNETFDEQFSGYSTDEVPSGNLQWSPRLGFNYDFGGERITQIRGGVGIFSGRAPGVWLSNQYGNTGVDFARLDIYDPSREGNGVPAFEPDPNNQPRPGDGSGLNPEETTEINLTDPDFKLPQVFRADIAVDQELPYNFVGSIEVLYTTSVNDVLYRDLNLGEQEGTSAYGRPRYGDPQSDDFTNVILLDNTSKGHSYNFTAQLEKEFSDHWYGKLAYTYSRSRVQTDGTSSQAYSNWRYNETQGNPNDPPVNISDFEVPHRILGVFTYDAQFFEGYNSQFSLIYEGQSGNPFSYVYDGDGNGDGELFNDMIYIPANEEDIVLESSNWDELNTFIESDDYLSSNRGEIAERNASRTPFTHQLDFRFAQQIPTLQGQRLELTVDIFNVLNLINYDWGEQQYLSNDAINLLDFNGYTNDGRPIVEFGDTRELEDRYETADIASRWQMQLGIRYSF